MRRKYKFSKKDVPNPEQLKQMAAQRRAVLSQAGLETFTLGFRNEQAAIVCLCCGLGSANIGDIESRYCGFCNAFH